MRHHLGVIVAVALVVGSAATAGAQVARVGGFVKDDTGQPIKGATIRADNPDAPLGTLTVATDDKGRFAIIGLARGEWSFHGGSSRLPGPVRRAEHRSGPAHRSRR